MISMFYIAYLVCVSSYRIRDRVLIPINLAGLRSSTGPELVRKDDSTCGQQLKNLGGNYTSAEECAVDVQADTECHQNVFMWSSAYPSWGCRCCTSRDAPGQHNLWDLYSITASELTAYWDRYACGPYGGEDLNWDRCGRNSPDTTDPNVGCHEDIMVDSSVCASGHASLFDVKGDGTDGSYVITEDGNSCHFWYFATWHCTDPPEYQSELVAYWDGGICGPFGEDHNWDRCGENSPDVSVADPRDMCIPEIPVSTTVCATGFASLFEVKGDGTQESYVNHTCPFWYFAIYHCTEPAPINPSPSGSCRTQVKNLGVFESANDCALVVQDDPECVEDVFMWSQWYNSWGCRCCESAADPRQHNLWNVFHVPAPTVPPTEAPTTLAPTQFPTRSPTESPTRSPTESPTRSPTEAPTRSPTESPTRSPTEAPTRSPTEAPTKSPTRTLNYWAVGPIDSNDVSDDSCGSEGILAMPKTHTEQQNILAIIPNLPRGGAHSGNYLWLGGAWDTNTESWCWNDGSQIGLPNTGETNWDDNQGEPGHAPDEPYFGLKRSTGEWHDFHGKWNERNPGMIALCQGFTEYWAVGPIDSRDVSDDSCGPAGILAMPKTRAEQENVLAILPSLPSGGAHSGNYVWLGGAWDTNTESWCWNDGSQIGLPDTGETNWDNNQGKPGHAPHEPYFGLKRSTGKWHDFHGKWNERNPGMIALCQASWV